MEGEGEGEGRLWVGAEASPAIEAGRVFRACGVFGLVGAVDDDVEDVDAKTLAAEGGRVFLAMGWGEIGGAGFAEVVASPSRLSVPFGRAC